MKCPNCGKEIANESVFCEYCGTKVSNKLDESINPINGESDEEASGGLLVVSFLIPLVGLIVYGVNIKEKPKKAKSCLKSALWSIGLGVVFNIVAAIIAAS